jgi:hypothetical protein
MTVDLIVQQAFIINYGTFRLTKSFRTALLRYLNVFLVMGMGWSRSGKSTKLNQLITGTVKAPKPFWTKAGSDRVTAGIEFCGPFKFNQLSFQKEESRVDVPSDPDVFMLDCKGFDSLNGEPLGLKKAIMSEAAIANVKVLILETFGSNMIQSIRGLLEWSTGVTGPIDGFARSTLILRRDVGIGCDDDASLEDKNRERRRQDLIERDKLLVELNKPTVVANRDTLTVLCQPQLTDVELYCKSINDAIVAIANVANRRRTMSGNYVIHIFDKISTILQEASELDIPDCQFNKAFADCMDRLTGPSTENRGTRTCWFILIQVLIAVGFLFWDRYPKFWLLQDACLVVAALLMLARQDKGVKSEELNTRGTMGLHTTAPDPQF